MIVLYILLFILCLSILIMVHEAGHLATAKIFKVYCFEYAIGFGPKIFSKKRKNGETYFSIRAIPFGGFVSMYGESETVPEGLTIDPSRSLLAIKKWKRAIIMAAGVIMNFLLAILIFFVYEVAFPTYTARYAHVVVDQNSVANTAGINTGDTLYSPILGTSDNTLVFYDDASKITYSDSSVTEAFIGYDFASLTLKDVSLWNHSHAYVRNNYGAMDTSMSTVPLSSLEEHIGETIAVKGLYQQVISSELVNETYTLIAIIRDDYQNSLHPLKVTFTIPQVDFAKFTSIPYDTEIYFYGNLVDKYDLTATQYKFFYPDLSYDLFSGLYKGETPTKVNMSLYVHNTSGTYKGELKSLNDIQIVNDNGRFKLNNIGLHMQLDQRYHKFGEAIGNTFKDFGEASTAIVRGLGALLTTKDGWREVGGIISIGVVSTQVLTQNGFGTYLRLWGLISVNLGIVNLLPFPGLDGWHLLVLAVEGIFKKEIPAKVKNIVAFVGIAILFTLMILIIIKDIVGLF